MGHFNDFPARKNSSLEARFLYPTAIPMVMMMSRYAMMMIRYLLDTDAPVKLARVDGPKDGFANIIAPIELALEQEKQVSVQISDLFKIARDAGDYLSEQFVQWFLKEQVEEVATMTELLDIANRTADIPMQIESYIARENPGTAGSDPSAPEAAGG